MDQQKYCTQCKLFKDLDEFPRIKYKDTFRYYTYCNSCKKQNGRKYYQQNKGKYKEHYQKFLEKNPDYQKNYRIENQEHLNIYHRNHYHESVNRKIIYHLMNKLKTNIIMKSNSMKSIIGCDIENLITWLYFTKLYNVIENENENLVIEHLNSSFNFDLTKDIEIKKYMNWKNLRIMSKSQNSKKNRNLSTEDKIRHQYLLHCFIHNKEPTIEVKNVY